MKKFMFTLIAIVMSTMAMAQDRIEVSELSVNRGEKGYIWIDLTNEKNYTAFQMDVELPSHLSMNTVKTDGESSPDIMLISERAGDSHIISSNEYTTRKYRIIVYSNSKETLKGRNGNLLRLSVTASSSAPRSTDKYEEVKISNITFVDENSVEHSFADVTSKVYYARVTIKIYTEDDNMGTAEQLRGSEVMLDWDGASFLATPRPGCKFKNWEIRHINSLGEETITTSTDQEQGWGIHPLICGHYTIIAHFEHISDSWVYFEGIMYSIENGTATVAKHGRNWILDVPLVGDIIIPSTIRHKGVEYKVTGVSNKAFGHQQQLTSVQLPESITYLGDSCFVHCNKLTTINLPESIMSIGKACFWYCSELTKISIPDNVTVLDEKCFYSCDKLSTVTLPKNLTSIGEWCFAFCSDLYELSLPKSITSIGQNSFRDCNFINVTCNWTDLSNLSIHRDAFYDIFSEAKLYVPTGTKDIYAKSSPWKSEFKSTNILETTRGEEQVGIIDGIRYHLDNGKAIVMRQSNGIANDIVIPEIVSYNNTDYKVVRIDRKAFYSRVRVLTITLPNSITSLGEYCFYNCDSIESITLPNNIESLEQACFRSTNITSINLPKSIKFIDYSCFRDCSKLDTIICNWQDLTGVKVLDDAFKDISATAKLYVPYGKKEVYATTAPWKDIFAYDNIIEKDKSQEELINDSIYAKLTQQIANIQSELENAKSFISSNCQDVTEQFSNQLSEIQANINALSTSVQEKHEKIELTEDSSIDTSGITAAIDKLKNDAIIAQQEYEKQQAIIKANFEAYNRLFSQIVKVQSTLNSTSTYINSSCKDVAPNYKATINALQTDLNTLMSELETKYNNIELTEESTVNTAQISEAIEQLKNDATIAQQEYEKQQAIITTNVNAYKRLNAQLTQVENELKTVKTYITNNCKDVADNYKVAIDSIQNELSMLKADVKNKYNNLELTEESSIDTSGLSAAIEQIKNAATTAQEEYDIIQANSEAYKRLSSQIADVQTQFNSASEDIHNNCKDVASNYSAIIDSIQNEINTLTLHIETKYNNSELTAESTIDTASILNAIEQVKTDAAIAQKEFEKEVGIHDITSNMRVDVYNIQGIKIASNVPFKEVSTSLPTGIYIINGKKYLVK